MIVYLLEQQSDSGGLPLIIMWTHDPDVVHLASCASVMMESFETSQMPGSDPAGIAHRSILHYEFWSNRERNVIHLQ